MFKHLPAIEKECNIRGVSFSVIADGQAANIIDEIARPEVNMDLVKLEKAPKMAVISVSVNGIRFCSFTFFTFLGKQLHT